MLHSNAYTITTREHLAAISNKGQITSPASVLRHLDLTKHRKVAIVVEPSGAVQLKAPKYPTLESIFGAVRPLAQPMSMKEIREVIADDIAEAHQPKYT